MDNHPIPQDVTGFQFRLIGDMTVKQFAYVAVGGIFAVVFMHAPIPILLRVPLMILSGGFGVVLAFVPIEGRPLDVMVGHFLKALITPNQYAYHKTGGSLPLFGYQTKPPQAPQPQQSVVQNAPTQQHQHKDREKEKKLKSYLTKLHEQNLSPLEQREQAYLQGLALPRTQGPAVEPPKNSPHLFQREQPKPTIPSVQQIQTPEPVQQAPQQEAQVSEPVQQSPIQQPSQLPDSNTDETPKEKSQNLSLQENVLEQELTHAKQEEQAQTDSTKKEAVHSHVTALEKQLQEIQQQKEALERELAGLKATVQSPQAVTPQVQSAQQQATPQPEPTAQSVEPPQQQQAQDQTNDTQNPSENGQASVRKITAEMAKNLGLPHIPEVPNLIIGIVKDPRGNVLSNILVEVKDQDGTPARAFRTNQLGQFASATPLSEGTYTIEFEDPKGQHLFDTVEITADNQILMPIEVISHDEREELRKALFN